MGKVGLPPTISLPSQRGGAEHNVTAWLDPMGSENYPDSRTLQRESSGVSRLTLSHLQGPHELVPRMCWKRMSSTKTETSCYMKASLGCACCQPFAYNLKDSKTSEANARMGTMLEDLILDIMVDL